MKIVGKVILIIGICVLTGMGCSPRAKITVKVVDDDGKPLPGMNMGVGFYGAGAYHRKGKSDINGIFVIQGKAIIGLVGYFVLEKGYYYTSGEYVFSGSIKDGKYQPWNPVITSVVRRIINPIPMYAKHVETMIPTTNVPCGYDLMVGDWITPNGIGKNADVLFQVERTVVNIHDYDVDFKVVFTNQNDGLQSFSSIKGSTFTSPRYAPTDGYKGLYERKMGRKPGKGSYNTNPLPEEYSAYRIRTVIDDKGHTISAYYGKITSGFEIAGYGAEKVTILFNYYLNPTPNDRNMEFDPKKNLLKGLKSTEEVTAP